MSSVRSILCSGALQASCAGMLLLGLAGCGQRGPLYLPTDPAAANRATLPQSITPLRTPATPSSATTPTNPTPPQPGSTEPPTGGTGTGTASPVRTP